MDDYSRFILAWKLQRNMAADPLIDVVQEAVDAAGITEVPAQDRTKPLSDNRSGQVSRAFWGSGMCETPFGRGIACPRRTFKVTSPQPPDLRDNQ